MILSEKGLALIAYFEGYKQFPYNDSAGYATIGYGHLLHYSKVNLKDRLRYPKGLSHKAALKLLRKDALKAQRAVQQLVKRPLKQYEFDALCSFTFNCGGGGISTFHTTRRSKSEC